MLVLASGVGVACAQPAPPSPGLPDVAGRIAFISDRWGGLYQLYTVNPDGSDLRRVTQMHQGVIQPAWSPVRQQFAFVHAQRSFGPLVVVDVTGSQRLDIAQGGLRGRGASPVWSPDGRYLIYMSAFEGNLEIYRIDMESLSIVNLTRHPADDFVGPWSPDSKRLLFTSLRQETLGVFVMDADGAGTRRLTDPEIPSFSPAWSPDGRRIAYTAEVEGNRDVYVMDADGSDKVRLTTDPAEDQWPVWSPDGSKILFLSTRDGNRELYVMNADGSNQVNLTNHPGNDGGLGFFGWSPDGRAIVFDSNREGVSDVFVVRADGSGMTNLTRRSSRDFAPLWMEQAN